MSGFEIFFKKDLNSSMSSDLDMHNWQLAGTPAYVALSLAAVKNTSFLHSKTCFVGFIRVVGKSL